MSRSRNFTFTHNNYENTVLEDSVECKYIIYGKEVAPTTGTPHLQGFVSFETLKSVKQVRALFVGSHVEVAKTIDQAIEYCKKEGDWTERGQPPLTPKEKGAKEKLRWEEARQLAREGRFEEIQSEMYIRYRSTLHAIHNESRVAPKDIDGDLPHEWIYGPAGCGKSSTARAENPGAYLKDLTKWWDNYDDEDVVIIDDVDKYDVKFARWLKIWCDRYQFPAEMKGGSKVIRPGKVVITSQYHPDEIWDDERTQNALNRRLNIREMGSQKRTWGEYKGGSDENAAMCFCAGLCTLCKECKGKTKKARKDDN